MEIGDRNLKTNLYNGEILTSETYGNGLSNEYIYDENQNIIAQNINGNLAYEWYYDDEGDILSHKDLINNNSFTYEYIDGNLHTVNADNGFKISCSETDDKYTISYTNGNVTKTQDTIYDNVEEVNTDEFIPINSTINLISGGKLLNVMLSEETEERTIYSNENSILNSIYKYSDNGIN